MKNQITKIEKNAGLLQKKFGDAPKLAIVLGSGLKDLDFGFTNIKTLDTEEIEGWPRSTVEGHKGVLIKGTSGKTDVMLQVGRVHLYEGHDILDVVLPVRSFIKWGVKNIIFTNAAGGINEYLKPGMLMFIEDHINLTGRNPLMGKNIDSIGVRFPDMSDAYDRSLRALMVNEASTNGVEFKIGTYAGLTGPSYETPAEIKMLRTFGADAVGMSTVLEVIAAKHMGATVGGISTISNMAATYDGAKISHDDVQESAFTAKLHLEKLLGAIIDKI